MVAEVLSIGTWSIVFTNLENRGDKKLISAPLPLSPWTIRSWLHAIAYLRNLCAHHSRLWNRRFTITPEVPKEYKPHMEPNTTFRAQAAMLHILMNVIASDFRRQHRLHELFQKHPDVPPGGWALPMIGTKILSGVKFEEGAQLIGADSLTDAATQKSYMIK
ncbi:MAG: Abi family protein [Gammaproteobacteria bacterium]|nr:Abi family protein [Gammaproteobacteria bacterium]